MTFPARFSTRRLVISDARPEALSELCDTRRRGRGQKQVTLHLQVFIYTNTEMRSVENQEQLHCSVASSLAFIPYVESHLSAHT